MGYSGALGKLIHEKNQKSKISCQTPFKLNKLQATTADLSQTLQQPAAAAVAAVLCAPKCRLGGGKVGMLWY